LTSCNENEALLDFLSRPESYGLPADEKITRIDTHASHVFLAGGRAFKMKKPVTFSFLDFSTLEKRRETCERELELNRRTAPDIYLAVTPVRKTARGFHIGDAQGEPVEWLVEMKRFGDESLLATKAEKGELMLSLVEKLAGDVARFHTRAEVRREAGGADNFAKIVADNEGDMRESIGPVFDARQAERVTTASKRLIERHRALMDERRATGWVRHCHGDLHLGNVAETGGKPVIFDCIEFNDRIARIDVLYDLAFLLMDLGFRAQTDARLAGYANRALNVYLDHVAQADIEPSTRGLALLPLFMATRAVVRAKVTAVQAKGGKAAEQRDLARAYLGFAARIVAPVVPRLVAVGGLSGTGKSTMARALAARLGGPAGAVHLRSDTIRKRLFGVRPLDRLPDGAYAPGVGARVYEEMVRLARLSLETGTSVIVDAVFAKAAERAEIGRLAEEMGLPLEGLWLEAPADVLEARVAAREKDGRDPSDAGVEVLRKQLSYDPGPLDWERVDASGTPKEALGLAREALHLR